MFLVFVPTVSVLLRGSGVLLSACSPTKRVSPGWGVTVGPLESVTLTDHSHMDRRPSKTVEECCHVQNACGRGIYAEGKGCES